MFRFKRLASTAGFATFAFLTLPQANADGLKVVSTFSIISDFAKNVGGERIALTTLVGPDGDAHAYEPRPSDAAAIRNADVVLANGAHFEGFLERLVKASGGTTSVVELTKGARLLRNAEEEHNSHEGPGHDDHGHKNDHHGDFDPHAWQSVQNAQIYVNNIAEAFCAADKSGCASYRVNAKSYGDKLKALDHDLKTAVQQVPSDRRTLITSHDAFAYLGHEYGFQLLAPQGASTDSEASAADIAALIRQIKQQKASAIFLENVSNPRLIQQIARETGMKVGGKLYSDALSSEGGPASTYVDMMRHNIGTILDAVRAP
ncbi:metal ABC transporter substrate-binding protein [Pollutimonas bauzanensis]|jgi:zinc/manganese transport system substrate-binding protein|uniref:metal ABC transporter substrate-binding protein n=1 Tax=Pollutimonas bauzanensis TaxID=658167 RepID=UPI0033414369